MNVNATLGTLSSVLMSSTSRTRADSLSGNEKRNKLIGNEYILVYK